MLEAIVATSSLLGLTAAIMALRIRRYTGRSPVPMLIASALGGASIWHAIRLLSLEPADPIPMSELATEALVLLVFLSVNAGLVLVGPLFEAARKATQARLDSEARYRNLFENAHVGIYRTTPDGRIIMANPALVRMLGYWSLDELSGRNLENEGFGPDYHRSRFKELVERPDGVRGLESAWTTAEGNLRYIREMRRRCGTTQGRWSATKVPSKTSRHGSRPRPG